MPVIQKAEMNSLGRARQSKIMSRESYTSKGVEPGHLDLQLEYRDGSLKVFLERAKLGGKKSQDAYAIVYLLDKQKETYFQEGNYETQVFKKNIEPNFNQRFEFHMSVHDLASKSLVVAIWDRDSKSRDDYMAGVRLSLQDIQYFTMFSSVQLSLMHQDMDGHPAAYDDEIHLLRKLFHYHYVETVKGSLDLKSCNNHLVSFIERARVLAEAYDFKNNMPESLTNTVSTAPLDVRQMFRDEIARMKSQISLRRAERTKLESDRTNLRRIQENLVAEKNRYISTLAEKRRAYYKLCCEHAEISVQFGSIDLIKQQTGMIWEKMNFVRLPEPNLPFRETVSTVVPAFSAGGGGSNVKSLQEQYAIRVRTEYERRIKECLETMRGKYQAQYTEFIQKLERDANEIIRLYEDILREKFNPKRRDGLLAIWEGRNYQGRIEILLRDIEELKRKIAALEATDKEGWYKAQIAELEAKIKAIMDDIRALFGRFNAFTASRFKEVNEVSLYKQFLDFEERRMSSRTTKVHINVQESRSKMQRASVAGMNMVSGGIGGGEYRTGASYATSGSTRRSVADSGISSPMEPAGTVGGYSESYSSSSMAYTQHRSSRTSVSSGISNADFRRSMTLEGLKGEVMDA